MLRRTAIDQPGSRRATTLMNLATVYLEQGDHAAATPLLLQASKLQPDVLADLGQPRHDVRKDRGLPRD